MALQQEWNGRHQRGMESEAEAGSSAVGQKRWSSSTLPSSRASTVRLSGNWLVWRSWSAAKRDPAGTSRCRKNSSGHSSWRESGGCGTSGTVYATGQTRSRHFDESETGKPAGASATATELCPVLDPDEMRLSADEQRGCRKRLHARRLLTDA